MKIPATPVTRKTDSVGKVSGNTIFQNSRTPVAPSRFADSMISGEMDVILFEYISVDVPKHTKML